MSNISERYIIGVDINSIRTESSITVVHPEPNGIKQVVHVIRGIEAELVYELLTNKKLEKEIKNG